MRSTFAPLTLAALLGAAAHFGILHYAPTFIMDRAYTMLGQRGTPLHGFNLAPRMTAETQSVVRPSPDLAYSACRFDLSSAPNGVRVAMGQFSGYSSLSFFDAQTNNFRTIRGNVEAQETVLLRPAGGTPYAPVTEAEDVTHSPSQKGIILIRRLAPTEEEYVAAAKAAQGDECRAL